MLSTQEGTQLQHPRHKTHCPASACWDSKSLRVEFRGCGAACALPARNHLTNTLNTREKS